MNLRLTLAALVVSPLLAWSDSPATQPALDAALGQITGPAILKDIEYLASDELKGREYKSPEAKIVADWIAAQFEAAGLKPLDGQTSMLIPIRDKDGSPNVAAVWTGKTDRVIMVTAHYDHLGVAKEGAKEIKNGDRIFNGADDNASGTSGMLAIARTMKTLGPLDASIVFVAFSGEEAGFRGSRVMAGESTVPIASIVAMFNLDMIGRGREDLIFVDGGKEAGPMIEALKKSNADHKIGLDIHFSEKPEWIRQSDQFHFILRHVPAVLFSVEDHPDYHQVTDTPDKILTMLSERVSRVTLGAVVEMSQHLPTTQPATKP